MKKTLSLILALVLVFALCACGTQTPAATQTAATQTAAAQTEQTAQTDQILTLAESFAYPSLDAHKEYYGWYTSIYGLTETLFKMDDNSVAQPWLAESAEDDGNIWTVTLKDGICFSNGTAVTADMVVRNLQRAAAENERFAYLADFEMKVTDDKIFTITTPDIYPTMVNDLASPELAIMDLDGTTDFDNAPVCTGPFVISSFEPEGTVEVVRNENYWGGDVKLAGATFLYMQEDDPKQMAMQNGEIDGYTSVTAAALETFESDPDTYQITVVPATRLQFYALNENRLDASVREAINLTVDKDAIAKYLSGTVSAAVGPFGTSTAYGQVTVPAVDTAKVKSLLEADGYTRNASGIYEKDGTPLSLNICYYAARSLDTLATLIQEQLKAVGIDSKLTCEEDPDSTYIATGDFDIALYCMIADKAGDPYYLIDAVLRQDSRWAIAGFDSDECEKLIGQLQYETDTAKRAELANQIVQISIDDNAFGYVGLFNKTTVLRAGVTGYSETCPFDFYGIGAGTTKTP
ncbi:MAG: ABC transporter substrate-binding protein [Oscillospiraceae bacterium]|nr:ABC transporter substrate-binding protein [Oscillospiraceae bacterium]